jgi:hypothetical protein
VPRAKKTDRPRRAPEETSAEWARDALFTSAADAAWWSWFRAELEKAIREAAGGDSQLLRLLWSMGRDQAREQITSALETLGTAALRSVATTSSDRALKDQVGSVLERRGLSLDDERAMEGALGHLDLAFDRGALDALTARRPHVERAVRRRVARMRGVV